MLDEAERLYVRSPVPDLRPVAALKTRIRIAQGRLAEARDWVREQGLSVDDDPSYLREFNLITLARILVANDTVQEAIELLERLKKAAEEGGRTGSLIEILVLQALAHQALADLPAALDSLERALTLAEPEGYVRIFVTKGRPCAISFAMRNHRISYYTPKLHPRLHPSADSEGHDRS